MALHSILLHRCNRLKKRRWRQIVQPPEDVGGLLPEEVGSASVLDRGEGKVLWQAITSSNYKYLAILEQIRVLKPGVEVDEAIEIVQYRLEGHRP